MTAPAPSVSPTSSAVSRSAACSAVSPASRRPPGSAHCPACARSRGARRVSSRQGAPLCAVTHTATAACLSSGRSAGTRGKPASRAATASLSILAPFSPINPRYGLATRPPPPAPRVGSGRLSPARPHTAGCSPLPPILSQMQPRPRSAQYFDGWYADRVAMPAVDEIMNRHTGFPPGTRAGVVPAEAIPELAGELRLRPGGTLLDLACGRGAYGLLIARKAGSSVIGVDFSAQALAEAREQA